MKPVLIALSLLLWSGSVLAECSDDYYKITIRDGVADATKTNIEAEKKSVGSYRKLLERDRGDRRIAMNDMDLTPTSKSRLISWLDANIRNSSCRNALGM